MLYTVRYLATDNFIFLYYEYLLGATTVREIVRGTCDAICEWTRPIKGLIKKFRDLVIENYNLFLMAKNIK